MKKWLLTFLSVPLLLLAKEPTLEEKVGQLFMLPFSPSLQAELEEVFTETITRYNIGGVLIKQGSLRQTADTIYKLQQLAATPLLISSDSEWGLGARVSDGRSFPKAFELGGVQSKELTYLVAKAIGSDCKKVGIHWNFAPVMDITGDEINPVINKRSFGTQLDTVTDFAMVFAKGLEDEGVMACGKHFPNHGAVTIDSHKGLPVLDKTLKQMNERDLVPFKAACSGTLSSMMVAHILVPELDPQLPASLSSALVEGIIKEQWGYEGLIVTDALNMGALNNLIKPGTLDKIRAEDIPLLALRAGCDVLLYGTYHVEELKQILEMLPQAIDQIVAAAYKEPSVLARIEESFAKIMKYKAQYIDTEWTPPTDEELLSITSIE